MMSRLPYEHPFAETIELGAQLDVCNYHDPFDPTPGGGWEDDDE